MSKPFTHRVGTRHITYGVWREPNTFVDASDWPNRDVLESGGYLFPLTEDDQARLLFEVEGFEPAGGDGAGSETGPPETEADGEPAAEEATEEPAAEQTETQNQQPAGRRRRNGR